MALQCGNDQIMPAWISKLLEDADAKCVQYLRKHDTQYQEMQKQYQGMQKQYPYIEKLFDDCGEIFLSHEEHEIILEFLQLQLKMEIRERELLCWIGHKQCYEYLNKVGMLKYSKVVFHENSKKNS